MLRRAVPQPAEVPQRGVEAHAAPKTRQRELRFLENLHPNQACALGSLHPVRPSWKLFEPYSLRGFLDILVSHRPGKELFRYWLSQVSSSGPRP